MKEYTFEKSKIVGFWVWVLGFIPKFFWVLDIGFGCGYETHTQNPNPDFFGCECMVWRYFTNVLGEVRCTICNLVME